MSFNEIAHMMEVSLLFKWEFPRVLHDDVAYRLSANFKCEVGDVNNDISIDFRAVKFVSVVSDQSCYDKFSSTNFCHG